MGGRRFCCVKKPSTETFVFRTSHRYEGKHPRAWAACLPYLHKPTSSHGNAGEHRTGINRSNLITTLHQSFTSLSQFTINTADFYVHFCVLQPWNEQVAKENNNSPESGLDVSLMLCMALKEPPCCWHSIEVHTFLQLHFCSSQNGLVSPRWTPVMSRWKDLWSRGTNNRDLVLTVCPSSPSLHPSIQQDWDVLLVRNNHGLTEWP